MQIAMTGGTKIIMNSSLTNKVAVFRKNKTYKFFSQIYLNYSNCKSDLVKHTDKNQQT